MEYIDLHTHSTCSDGTQTPSQLIRAAKDNGLAALSLTDHDTIDGVREALAAGLTEGIMVLSGIEISAYLDDIAVHILGYGFDPDDRAMADEINELQKIRHERNIQILANLNKLGFTVTAEDLDAIAAGQIGRPHFAALLVKQGVVGCIDEAFQRFLKKDARAYAPKKKHDARQVIRAITEAGGIAVLAHPMILDRSLKSLPHLLVRLKEAGLGGLEAYYPSQNSPIRRRLIAMADRYGLLVTGGSDYHGPERGLPMAGRQPGRLKVPIELFSSLNQLVRYPARTGILPCK